MTRLPSQTNRRVLVIAYYYPPLAGAGILKVLRTTRYLGKFGWDPVVLTVRNPEPYHRAPNPIPEGVKVYRARRIPGGNLLARVLRRLKLDERWLFLPDQHIFWIPGLLWLGLKVIKREAIDLIYVTAPPYSALLAGAFLAQLTGKPLVVDIRDPWSFNAARNCYPTALHRGLDKMYERWVLKTAAYITCIYQITARGYRQLYPWTAAKTAVFYDTVDPADLPDQVSPKPVFTLTYLGTFYPPFRSLRATLAAIRVLLDSGAITPDKFRLNYVGPRDYSFNRLVAEYGLEPIIDRTGYLPLGEAQLEAAQSQMLLLLLEFATINTKLFDYLAIGNPILAVVPEFEELEELLDKYCDSYYTITDNDTGKIAAYLKECYNGYYHGNRIVHSQKRELFLDELNIETETAQLAEIFTKIETGRI